MPQVTVYIREDDLDKWKALEKKSEFIHHALRGTPKEISPPSKIKSTKNIKINDNGTMSPIKPREPSEVITEMFTVYECKNGHILNKFGKCTTKGCKYA